MKIALTPSRMDQLLGQTRNALKIVLLAMFWFVVPICYIGVAVYAFASAEEIRAGSRALGIASFHVVFGTGVLCALHAKSGKFIQFLWGALAGICYVAFMPFLAIALRRVLAG